MKAPEHLRTVRLLLRRPVRSDIQHIFDRYASDQEVTKFLGWPRHTCMAQTNAFLKFSDIEWERWPAGPYLIEREKDGHLIGSTGLIFETAVRAVTGYVLAKDAWGLGFATEALQEMVRLGESLGMRELIAQCHPDHRASSRVLEKCNFVRETYHLKSAQFPNLMGGCRSEALCYVYKFRCPST